MISDNLFHTRKILLCVSLCEDWVLQTGIALETTGWGKSRFTVVCMENNIIINKKYKNKLCVLHSHNCKPPFAPSCNIATYSSINMIATLRSQLPYSSTAILDLLIYYCLLKISSNWWFVTFIPGHSNLSELSSPPTYSPTALP